MPKHPKEINKDLLSIERRLVRSGARFVCGLDEAGRGCLAGPVFAGAVILPHTIDLPKVDDSKKLSARQRDDAYELICQSSLAWAVASVSSEEIDRTNIHQASLQAMYLALSALQIKPDYLIIDGKFKLPHPEICMLPQEAIVDGDALSLSIAAASILAKVSRDRWMVNEGRKYPQYNFAKHKGYGTHLHRQELSAHGPTEIHRKTFRWKPVEP